MSFNFTSFGHFVAASIHDFKVAKTAVANAAPKIESVLEKAQPFLADVPVYGSELVILDRAAEASLGGLTSLLMLGGSDAKSKLAAAGVDSSLLEELEALTKDHAAFSSLLKVVGQLKGKPATAVNAVEPTSDEKVS